jgi:hypothetical protein
MAGNRETRSIIGINVSCASPDLAENSGAPHLDFEMWV